MADDPLKKRASILEMAAAQGKTLKPEHMKELQRYREMGVLAGQKGAGAVGMTAEARSAAKSKVAAARGLREQLERVEQLYKNGIGSGRSATEYLPTPQNKQFDAAVQGMMPLARQAFRVPGSGADTEREAIYLEKILPNRMAFDEANDERLSNLRRMLDDVEREYGSMAGESAEQARAPKRLVYDPATGEFR